jgi:hypothetical protein
LTPVLQIDPAPEMPAAFLEEGFGGPTLIETACVNLDPEPGFVDGDDVRRWLADSLRFMGIEVVDSGCDLDVKADLSGSRYSADYAGGAMTCFTGFTAQGVVVVSHGDERWDWDVSLDHEPPDRIDMLNGCLGPREPLPSGVVVQQVWTPFADLFGALARVAVAFGDRNSFGTVTGSLELSSERQPDPADVAVLAAALRTGGPGARCDAVAVAGATAWNPGEQDLSGLVPHLIATYVELANIGAFEALGDPHGSNCITDLNAALGVITDETGLITDERWIHGPAAWSEWWIETQSEDVQVDRP